MSGTHLETELDRGANVKGWRGERSEAAGVRALLQAALDSVVFGMKQSCEGTRYSFGFWTEGDSPKAVTKDS